MLQRAAETVSGDDECNDPAVLLACALGSTGCPAKCSDEAQKAQNDGVNPYEGVQAGDLNVAVSNSSSVTSIPNSGVIKVAELAVKASENIQLQSVSVTREGLSQNSNLKVWIEKDGRRITSSSSFFGDSKANLTFNNNGYVVNGNETLDLVISLSGVAAGSELQFKVSDLVSSAKSSSISPDTTSLFRTADYKATSISFVSVNNSDRSYNLSSDTTFSFGEFKLQNDSSASMEKDVLIKSITFKVEGSIENLSNMKLLRDGKEVSSKYTVDGKSVTFAVNDQLDSGKSATYKVTAVPTVIENSVTASAGGDTYKFKINKDSDVIAEEIGSNATAYRVSVKGTMPVDLGTTTIKGGNITLTRDSSLASTVSADWGYSDVVIAKGTIKVNQGVKFEKSFITGGTITDTASKKLPDILRRAALVIDGKSYQAEISNAGLSFDSEIYFSKGDHNVELQVSLANAGTATKFTMSAIDKDTFRVGSYTNGDETVFASSQVAGTIRVSDVNIQQKKTSIKKTGPSEDVKVAKGNTDEKVLLVGEISNTSDKVLEINKFVLTGTYQDSSNTVSVTDLGDVYLVLGDSTSSMYNVATTASAISTVSIDSVTTTIDAGKSVKFEIRYVPDANLTDTNVNSFRFSVAAVGKLDGNDTTSSSLNSAKVTVTAGATSTVVGNTTDNKQIIKPGESRKIASFNYNVKNDSVDINNMEFIVAGIDAATLDDLTIDFGGSVGTPSNEYRMYDAAKGDANATDSSNTNTLVVTFDNVVTLPVANYKVNVYATFNDSAILANTAGTAGDNAAKQIKAVAFNPQDNWIKASTAASLDATKSAGAATLGYRHFVAKAYPVLSVKDKNTTSENARLDIAIVKNNDDANTVAISQIDGVDADDGSASYWHVIEGSDTDLANISIDYSNATVIRSSKATDAGNMNKSISKVSFTVKDDEGKIATYTDVDAGSDFASLSL